MIWLSSSPFVLCILISAPTPLSNHPLSNLHNTPPMRRCVGGRVWGVDMRTLEKKYKGIEKYLLGQRWGCGRRLEGIMKKSAEVCGPGTITKCSQIAYAITSVALRLKRLGMQLLGLPAQSLIETRRPLSSCLSEIQFTKQFIEFLVVETNKLFSKLKLGRMFVVFITCEGRPKQSMPP